MAELASDIVYEIITRAPSLQALDCCKSVSKEWEHLIDDPDFMFSFCQRTKSVSGYFIQGDINSQTVSRFVSLHDDDEGSSRNLMRLPTILASCRQGLLCCHDGNFYSVCKPTTRQSLDLPSPGSPPWETISVAILVQRSSPLRYKIVRLSNRTNRPKEKEGYNSFECEVFDSEAWGWRGAGAMKLPTPELIIKPSPSVVTAANSVCWLTTHDNVVEFCEPNKSFHKFPLPETIERNKHPGNYGYKRLVEYQGRLGLVCESGRDNRCFELWLKEPGMRNIDWVKKMEFTRVEDIAKPVGFYNPGIAFFKYYSELTFYRVEDSSSLKKVEINWPQAMGGFEVFPFRSDSEPVHLGKSC